MKKQYKHFTGYNKDNPLHSVWCTMHARCYRKTHEKYPIYGGRGITMCDEWLGKDGFHNFCQWSLSYGWHRGLTLDRKDNDKGYSPENCRWVTPEIQNNNKRNVKRIEYKGYSFTLSQLAQFLDVDCEYLRQLINKEKHLSIDEIADRAIKNGKPYTPYKETKKGKRKRSKTPTVLFSRMTKECKQ